jgi:hypothetical protein
MVDLRLAGIRSPKLSLIKTSNATQLDVNNKNFVIMSPYQKIQIASQCLNSLM